MTLTPTDRGIAFIATNPDGTKNVYVAGAVGSGGDPQDVIAMHLKRPSVDVEDGIELVASGSMVRTTGSVRVFSGPKSSEVVRIRTHNSGPEPLFRR